MIVVWNYRSIGADMGDVFLCDHCSAQHARPLDLYRVEFDQRALGYLCVECLEDDELRQAFVLMQLAAPREDADFLRSRDLDGGRMRA